jgi:choline dehydrogenase
MSSPGPTGDRSTTTHHDYVVVGAGSAGCVLAARLSEDPEVDVLLLEAGGDGLLDVVREPPRWPTLNGTERDWAYVTTSQGATGHAVNWPRGRGLGGSHATNAMAFLRGHPTDFDSWAYAGNPGWSYEQVLPYFRRTEDVPGGDPHHRGRGGPLRVGPTAEPHPLALAFVEACVELGHPRRLDFNCGELDGAGLHDMTITGGVRQTTADAYLRPALSRPNLTLELEAGVRRLVIERGRCRGVEFVKDGAERRAHASAEVILCAGAVDSPRLLLLSGIGDPAELAPLGIEPTLDLPGVGANLHDHVLLCGLCVEASRPIPPARGNLGEAVLYWRSDERLPGPDLQIVLIDAPFLNPWQQAPPDSYTFAVAHMRPQSRGGLTLASADPDTPPRIDPNYLGERHDVEMLLQGVEKALDLQPTEAFRDWHGRAATAGPAPGEAATVDFLRDAVNTFSHPVGTCRMGVDEMAVVDAELRVHGLDGLRVVDASVMPSITSTNTNAATIMIAEKAADLILGRPTPV